MVNGIFWNFNGDKLISQEQICDNGISAIQRSMAVLSAETPVILDKTAG